MAQLKNAGLQPGPATACPDLLVSDPHEKLLSRTSRELTSWSQGRPGLPGQTVSEFFYDEKGRFPPSSDQTMRERRPGRGLQMEMASARGHRPLHPADAQRPFTTLTASSSPEFTPSLRPTRDQGASRTKTIAPSTRRSPGRGSTNQNANQWPRPTRSSRPGGAVQPRHRGPSTPRTHRRRGHTPWSRCKRLGAGVAEEVPPRPQRNWPRAKTRAARAQAPGGGGGDTNQLTPGRAAPRSWPDMANWAARPRASAGSLTSFRHRGPTICRPHSRHRGAPADSRGPRLRGVADEVRKLVEKTQAPTQCTGAAPSPRCRTREENSGQRQGTLRPSPGTEPKQSPAVRG